MKTEKLDIHNSEPKFDRAIEILKNNRALGENTIALILSFITDASLGRHGGKGSVGFHKLLRYLDFLQSWRIWFGKDFDKLTDKSYAEGVQKLISDKFRKKNGKRFTLETKHGYISTLNLFVRYLKNQKKLDLDINATAKLKLPKVESRNGDDFIAQTDWDKVARQADGEPRAVMKKAALMTLFDGGPRVEEFLNITIHDVEIKKSEAGQSTAWLRIQHSKTEPRIISVPFATDYLVEWLNVHPDRSNRKAKLFDMTYAEVRLLCRRATEKAVGIPMHPHGFRHSSATYYAKHLSEAQRDYRYGWTIGSNMGRRYINRDQLEGNTSVENAFAVEEVKTFQKENQNLKDSLKLLNARLQAVEQRKQAQFYQMSAKNIEDVNATRALLPKEQREAIEESEKWQEHYSQERDFKKLLEEHEAMKKLMVKWSKERDSAGGKKK